MMAATRQFLQQRGSFPGFWTRMKESFTRPPLSEFVDTSCPWDSSACIVIGIATHTDVARVRLNPVVAKLLIRLTVFWVGSGSEIPTFQCGY